jgi:hypothetical protein
MPAPSIGALPVPPKSNDSQAVFKSKRKPWLDGFEVFIDELNSLILWINTEYAESGMQIDILPDATKYADPKDEFNTESNATAIALDNFIVQMNLLIEATGAPELSPINPLPPHPNKVTDSKSVFNKRAFAWMAALAGTSIADSSGSGLSGIAGQINGFVEWVNEPPPVPVETTIFAGSYVNDDVTHSSLVVDEGEIPFCVIRFNFNSSSVDKIWQFPKIIYPGLLTPNFLTMNGGYGVFIVVEESGDSKLIILPGSETLLTRDAWEAATVDYDDIEKVTPLGSAGVFLAAFNLVNIGEGVFAFISGQPHPDDPDGTSAKVVALQVVTFTDETDATVDSTIFDVEAEYPITLSGYAMHTSSLAVNGGRTALCSTIRLMYPADLEQVAALVLEFDLSDNSLTDHYVRTEVTTFPYETGANISPLVAFSTITSGDYSSAYLGNGYADTSTGNFVVAYDGFFTYSARSITDDGSDILEVFSDKIAISTDVELAFTTTLTTKLVSLGFTVSDDNPFLGLNMYLSEVPA